MEDSEITQRSAFYFSMYIYAVAILYINFFFLLRALLVNCLLSRRLITGKMYISRTNEIIYCMSFSYQIVFFNIIETHLSLAFSSERVFCQPEICSSASSFHLFSNGNCSSSELNFPCALSIMIRILVRLRNVPSILLACVCGFEYSFVCF